LKPFSTLIRPDGRKAKNRGRPCAAEVLDYRDGGWTPGGANAPDVVFAFLDPDLARKSTAFADLKARFPNTPVIGCTTGARFPGRGHGWRRGRAACLGFDGVKVQVASLDIVSAGESHDAGKTLAARLRATISPASSLSLTAPG